MSNTAESGRRNNDSIRGVLLLDVSQPYKLSGLSSYEGLPNFVYLTVDKYAMAYLTAKDIPCMLYDTLEDAIRYYPIPITGLLTDSNFTGVDVVLLKGSEGSDKSERRTRYPIGDSWWIASYLPREVFFK